MADFRSINWEEKNSFLAGEANARSREDVSGYVRKAIDGDYEAFGILYTSYVVPIYRYVFYQVKDKMTAEDITEETFLKAWRAIGTCKGREETFSSWLYAIAHNQIIDVFRRQQKQVSLEKISLAEFHASPQNVQLNVEQQELLKEIAYLPMNQKQIIVLKFIEGLSNSEISKITGKNEGAIRILQMRALGALRNRFNGGR